MGSTQDIKTLFFRSDLLARTCKQCDGYFTDNDYKTDNWDLEYRTNGSADFTNFRKGTSKGIISVVIELYHENCPELVDRHPPRRDHPTATDYKEANKK